MRSSNPRPRSDRHSGATSANSAGSACTSPRSTADRAFRSRSSWSWSKRWGGGSRRVRSCRPCWRARSSPPPLPRRSRRADCRAWSTVRSPAPWRSGAPSRSVTGPPRVLSGSSSVAAWPTSCSCRSATTSPSSIAPGPGCRSRSRRTSTRSRRAARVTLDGAPVEVLPGARQTLVDLARLIFAAEAIGVARQVTESASEYAKVRQQFGRPIATFQAVKHHCANMVVAAELATSLAWDAARAVSVGGDQLSYTCRHGGCAGDPGRRPERAAQHPGPRRDRIHLGARCASLPAAGRGDRGGRRCRGGGGGHHQPGPRRHPAGPLDRSAARGRADPRHGARVRRRACKVSTPTPSAPR